MRAVSPTAMALRVRMIATACALFSMLAALVWPATGTAETSIGAGSGSGPEQGWEFGGIYDNSDGQVVTAPGGVTRLRSFTLWAQEPTSFMFRGFVFAWNGSEATGPQLFESGDLHTAVEGSYQPFTLKTDVPVSAGGQYVVFLSQSKDEAADEGITYGEALGMVTGNFFPFPEPPPYTEGGLVAVHNGYRTEGWTTEAWYQPSDADAYFSASFASPPAVTSVAPSVAKAGDHVTISGRGFNAASEITFGTAPSTSFTVHSETEITAEVPNRVSGAVAVRVLTSAGRSAQVAADELTILAPPPGSPPAIPAQQTPAPAPAGPGGAVHARLRCVVPYMGGMRLSAVKHALHAAHCRLGRLVRHYNATRRGELVEQNRHQGTVAPAHSAVSIWLSLGRHSKRPDARRGA